MNQPDELQHVNFGIYQKHLNLIKEVNEENKSQGLRTILDSIITGQEQIQRKKIIDNVIMWSCFGGMLILLSYLFSYPQNMISILIGTFLFAYGTIGGAIHAIRRTKHYR